MTAARTGKVRLVKALIARRADVNAKEKRGQTALMWGSAEGHVEVVQTLLEAGADFRTPLASGFTPLAFAVREGRTDVVRVLLQGRRRRQRSHAAEADWRPWPRQGHLTLDPGRRERAFRVGGRPAGGGTPTRTTSVPASQPSTL